MSRSILDGLILWEGPQLHIIILTRGLHKLRVRQKTIFRSRSIKGYQKWVVNAETAVLRSVEN